MTRVFDGYREVARRHLLDERSWAVPAPASGHLFLRNTEGALACCQLFKP